MYDDSPVVLLNTTGPGDWVTYPWQKGNGGEAAGPTPTTRMQGGAPGTEAPNISTYDVMLI